ncbi:MAG: MFS transporter, partial [Tumebacillaceae bacterium]
MTYIQHGTPAFRKTTRALFAGGFVTFAILYSTQPLMPEFTREFGISPTLSSLSLSVSTIAMAVFMIIVGSLSEAWGRKPVMSIALLLSSLLAILTAFAPNFHVLLL